MTAGPPPVDSGAIESSEVDQPAVDPALARYTAGLRPARRRYIQGVVLVVGLLVAGLTTAWLTGEERATTVVTATSPEPAVPNEPLGTTLAVAWASEDATAGGSTKTQGTIVTYDEHAVRGRNALTGDVRWSYTRTDDTVCDVVTQDGIAVAVFAKAGNCDQAVGLDVETGQRRWNRTLLDSGASTMTSVSGSTLLLTATSVHVLSPGFDSVNVPSGGLDRWYWAPADCAVEATALGGRGVLASLSCTSTPRLVLRKPYEDGQIWSVQDSARPLVVTDGGALGWDASSSTLISFALDTGARAAVTTLPGCLNPVASAAEGLAVVLCNGALSAYSIDGGTLAAVWSLPAIALPVVPSTTEIADAEVVILNADATGTIMARSIKVQTGSPVRGPGVALPAAAQSAARSASRIERNGAGLLIAGTSTMVLSGAR